MQRNKQKCPPNKIWKNENTIGVSLCTERSEEGGDRLRFHQINEIPAKFRLQQNL